MTALELHQARTPTVGASEWGLMDQQAHALANSDIIPSAYRRKPANVLVAALTGRQYGWDVLTAMRNGHVIEGTWGMKPEAMLGLVRQAGHSVTAEVGTDGAKVTGKRADTDDEMTVSFTLEDAKRAGLANKGTWKNYPQMMCYWRAVGMLSRMLFSDVTLGAMSVEELGAQLDADGEIVDAGPIGHDPDPTPISDETWEKIRHAADEQDITIEQVMAKAYPDGAPDPMTERDLPHFRTVFKEVVAAKAAATQAEAEVVEAGEPDVEPDSKWVSADTGEAPAPRDDGSMRPATRKQVGLIKSHYDRIGLSKDRPAQLAMTNELLSTSVETHNHLKHDQASTVIDYLSKLPTHDGASEPATLLDDEIVDAEVVEDGES